MNNTQHKKPGFFPLLWETIKHIFCHNWGLKLLAVLLSVALWAGLISQDESLTRDKTFNDVNVTISGTDTMKRNGYIVVSDLSELLDGVSVTAEVPQGQYENAEASAYNVRVELSRISGTGTQELKLVSTASSTYGRVVSTNPASIMVEVEDYWVRQRIPVSVSVGDIPVGWYLSTPTVDPTMITVAGPRPLVENISRARAYLDPASIEWEEGRFITSVKFELYDPSGEVISSPLLEVTSDNLMIDSVVVEANRLRSQTFDVAELISLSGNVAKGYEVKDIRISPESITVSAREEVLSQLIELALEQRTISVKNLKETTTWQLKVQKPSDDAILSNDTVTVTVEIGPIDTDN